ncbi:hypothetical protein F9278_08640 [Streptomyces phaeolivaceus]|uniref:Uncharacterized protein n=1 Tax=Streptomyces phaeolivaceus TaxID=2653200 RepID=A0A5P8JZR1_9ACTN|nr:hypothetical protein [Streptomyces phaeolivaceus]QFQ96256.1 hypothetical protein F9278_08640 [Streptomyces phaeolivaceus]
MKRSGPLVTLLGGLVLALILLSFNATTGTRAGSTSTTNDPPPASAAPSPSPSPSPTRNSPSPRATPSPPADADYAGRTDDDSAAIAVTLRDGKAVAYFCDGRTQESWLKGDVEDDGGMRLTSKDGAELNGTLKGGSVRGTVDIGGREYGFTAPETGESALYRATANVRGAEVDGGWIVLPDGSQVGILKRDGKAAAAPEIDPETGAVTVDGQQLTARPVTPESSS